MRLHEAREAKAELLDRLAKEIAAGYLQQEIIEYALEGTAAGQDLDGRDWDATVADTEPSLDIAVGIASSDDGAAVAVRVFTHVRHQEKFVDVFERRHVRTDIRFVGPLSPLLGDATVGGPMRGTRGASGTVGAIVQRVGSGQSFALSNSHVLAGKHGAVGDLVYGAGDERIGTLAKFVPLARNGNRVDAAIALLESSEPATSLKVADPVLYLDATVVKRGAASGDTQGRLSVAELDRVAVYYADYGRRVFNRQIEIVGSPFSTPGDSGSTVWTEDGSVLGLLFAGPSPGDGSVESYANPFDAVVSELGLLL